METHQLESERFVRIMGTLASGVSILTALDEHDVPCGLTTTSVISISAEPPVLAVSFDARSRTLQSVLSTSRFAVHVMADGTDDVCKRFASKAANKFDGLLWYYGANGVPVLEDGVLAVALCDVGETFEISDHVLVTGNVVGGFTMHDRGRPTVYFKRGFHALAHLAELSAAARR